MRRLFALAVIAVSFITFGMAQSLDRSIENLEIVCNINGELSEAYLQALDSVIIQANSANELNTAILYRGKHLETVRKMKGDSCIEVAEDLWRLGNAYNMIGDTIAGKGYYIQASNVLEKNLGNIDNYVGYLVSKSEKCIQKQDNLNLAAYFGEIIELANIFSCLYGESSCQYFEMLIHISYIYNRIGDEDRFKQHCRMIIDNCNEIDSCNYRSVYLAYDFLKRYYFVNNQNYQQYQLAIEQLRKLDVDSASFINEKINVLWELFLLETNDIPLSLSFGQRLEDLLTVVYPIKDDLFHVPLYLQSVSRLARGNTIIKRFSEAIKYYTLCCEILEFCGEKESKQYYNSLLDLMICANDAHDSRLVFQISDEKKLKPMIELYSDCPDEDSYIYSISMYNAYLSINQYDTALYYCNEMDSVMTQIHENTCYEHNIDSIRIGIAYNKAVVLYEMGLYKESYELFNNCLEQTKKLLSEDNLLYFDCLNNIAACQIALGYYAESAITSNNALFFIKSHWGTENETYLYCLHNSIVYNNRIGDCHKMLELALEEQSVCNVIYGVDSQEYANALGSLGAAYSCMNEFEKAIECYSKAFQILEAHNPKPSTIAPLLHNMSRDLFEMGDDEGGMRYLEKAEIALDSLYGHQSHEFAQFEYSFAKLLMTRGDSDAYHHFKNVSDVLFE